jgi:hypothetical protein
LLKKPGASAPWRDLSRYRRYGPKLTAEDERLFIALAQSGHDGAGWQLHQAFHGKILGLAGKHVPKGSTYLKKRPGYKTATLHTSELFEDLVAAGHLALWEAIKGFNVYSEYRLWTFASKGVSGAIRDASYAFRRHVAGVNRIDRFLFSHWNVRPEDFFKASKTFGLKRQPFETVEDAEHYIEVFRRRYSKESFAADTSEAEDFRSVYDLYRKSPLLAVHKRVSDVIDDLARGRTVEPGRYKSITSYFSKQEREKWTKQKPKKLKPLPLLRPRHWHTQSRKRRRKNCVVRAQSAEGRL